MRPQPWLIVVFVAALAGMLFAGVSTYDFVQHLDRQVHSLHCSFIPGMGGATGESGCQVAMMGSYSSVLRSQVWGGIPISLPAMAVFAFIAVLAMDLMLTRRKDDPRVTGFLALATTLPALASAVMLTISLTQLGTTCKLCVGIYVASAMALIGAIVLWRRAVQAAGTGATAAPAAEPPRKRSDGEEPAWVGASGEPAAPEEKAASPAPVRKAVAAPIVTNGFLAAAFGLGVLFVAVPVLAYLAQAPDHDRFIGTCDVLAHPDDTYGVMVRVERGGGTVPAIEVLDPLCPACRAFEDRLGRSGFGEKLDRRAILFPLDNTCNWMVTEATHPGACTVSEAVLCAGDRAPEVIAWAFEAQERVRAATKLDPTAAATMVKQRFPELAACVGSPEARSRLNKSLRWAVSNNIKVLTPQLFVENVKLCDEDVDLGLEYSLRVMLERQAARTLGPPPGTVPAQVPPPALTAEPPTGTQPAGTAPAPAGSMPPAPAPGAPAASPPAPASPGAPAAPAPGTEPTKPATTEPAPTKPADPAPAAPPPSDPAAPKPAPPEPAPAKPASPEPPAAPADQPVTKPSETQPAPGGTP